MTSPRSLRRRQLFAAAALPALAPASFAATPQQRAAQPSAAALTYASPFPRDFVFGVAAASAQIEGAAFEDGKGESVWDRFARVPGKVYGGHTPDVACDHYHRFDDDFALMASLGIKHYRLSIAWPRIYPNGDGALNPKGLDFYRRVFASMKKHGIEPWVTLFHWDLPQALEDRGGWTSRVTVDAFGRYADTVVKAFAGDVKHWITMNEIRCFTQLAYGYGTKAPGRTESAAVVMMIGTNNTGDRLEDPAFTVAGIQRNLDEIKKRQPQARVLLLALFPRGEKPDDLTRRHNARINALLPALADGRQVVFLDIGRALTNPDGTLSKDILPDWLHLSPQGYDIWARSLKATLTPWLTP